MLREVISRVERERRAQELHSQKFRICGALSFLERSRRPVMLGWSELLAYSEQVAPDKLVTPGQTGL